MQEMLANAMERLWGLFAFVVAIWVVEVLNLVSGYQLNQWFGLVPRRIGGLDGIVLMPLLHGSVAHAAANTGPLLVLGAVLKLSATRPMLPVNAVIVGLGGALVWVFGGFAVHVGASGLIFGWFAFLVARGVVDRHPVQLAISAGVAVVYGAMIWGVLPGQEGISWEAHLFGAVAGVVAAFLVRGEKRP